MLSVSVSACKKLVNHLCELGSTTLSFSGGDENYVIIPEFGLPIHDFLCLTCPFLFMQLMELDVLMLT